MESTSSTNRTLWIGLGILALVALLASSWGGGMMLHRGAFGAFGDRPFIGTPWMLGVWGVGLFFRLLFIGGLIFLLVRLFGGRRRHYFDDVHASPVNDLTPGEILRRRYAAGDITRKQYEEMRRTLDPSTA